MKKIFFVVALLVIIQVFVSCTKSGTDRSKTELLTTGGWRLESKQTKIGAATTWTDITSGVAACKKDDVAAFANPSTYTLTEGGSKCNAANSDIIATGSWALVNNQDDLKITIGSTSTTYGLYLVTENTLTIDETDASGIVVVYNRYIYSH
jgi:hypothetical protein